MYMERSIANGPLEEQANQPGTPSAAPARNGADVMPLQEAAACRGMNGSLPGTCAQMAFPYIPMQDRTPSATITARLCSGARCFRGLDLPFHRELKTRFPAANTHLSELMALDFAIDELGLYLTTHRDDQEALALYWNYIRLGQEGRRQYEEMHGPLFQTDITEGSFSWLDDPWPWERRRERLMFVYEKKLQYPVKIKNTGIPSWPR